MVNFWILFGYYDGNHWKQVNTYLKEVVWGRMIQITNIQTTHLLSCQFHYFSHLKRNFPVSNKRLEKLASFKKSSRDNISDLWEGKTLLVIFYLSGQCKRADWILASSSYVQQSLNLFQRQIWNLRPLRPHARLTNIQWTTLWLLRKSWFNSSAVRIMILLQPG